MAKSYEELATEMTVAWLNAAGQACASGKFSGKWLGEDSTKSIYKIFYKSICEAVNPDTADE